MRIITAWIALVCVFGLAGCMDSVERSSGWEPPDLPAPEDVDSVWGPVQTGGDEPGHFSCRMVSSREFYHVEREYVPSDVEDPDDAHPESMRMSASHNGSQQVPDDINKSVILEVGDQDRLRFTIEPRTHYGYKGHRSVGIMMGDGLKVVDGPRTKWAPFWKDDDPIVVEVVVEVTASGIVGARGFHSPVWSLHKSPCTSGVSYYVN